MKKWLIGFAVLAFIVLSWSVWIGRDSAESDAEEPATEVAVHVGSITQTTLRSYVTAYGVVKPRPTGEGPAASTRMAPSVPGVVTAVNCVEGQRVEKGEVLFELDSRAADVAVQFAQRNADREEQLWQVEGTSRRTLQEARRQLEAAQVQKALLQLQSPLSGTVVRVNVSPGEAVDLATVMAEIVDLDRLVASGGVPAADLPGLRVGQPAEVTAEQSGQQITAALDFIGFQVDPQSGLAELRVNLPADSTLRPGEIVTIRVVSEEHADSFAVPVDSVVHGPDGSDAIAIVDNDIATLTPVTTGLRDGGLVEIAGEGLRPGMVVVTQGAYGLPDQTRIRIIAN